MKLYLVDGTYELFRHHFGAPPRTAPDGRAVGATLGLLRSLLMLVTTPGMTHVACAFDHVIESFRNGLYPGYKTGAGVDPTLVAQFSLAEEAVAALGLVVRRPHRPRPRLRLVPGWRHVDAIGVCAASRCPGLCRGVTQRTVVGVTPGGVPPRAACRGYRASRHGLIRQTGPKSA